ATVIGMPCNTAHSPRILDAALEKLNATGRPVRFVHMIDAVVRHVRQRCGEGARVGILSTLATLETRLYQDSLERAGLRALHPAPDGCAWHRRPWQPRVASRPESGHSTRPRRSSG
ncbi:MAG: aspartate/glutamate racemase family protein, partial [Bilophila wadsworthia]